MNKNDIDWANIGFGYRKTDFRYISNYKDGKWDEGCLSEDANVVMSECAGVIHYCQTFISGLNTTILPSLVV